MNKERQSNIELLRILAGMAIIILHYIHPDIGGALRFASETAGRGYNRSILLLLESLLSNTVNLFVMMSGFFLYETQKRNLWKPIELIVQVVIFKIVFNIGGALYHGNPISMGMLIRAFVPNNYFAILYCCVYIVSPYANLVLRRLKTQDMRRMLFLLIAMFCVYPTIVDVIGNMFGVDTTGLSSIGMYGSQWGYSFVNFLLMYIIGAYLRKGEAAVGHYKSSSIVTCLFACGVLLTIWFRIIDKNSDYIARYSTAWEYCNPVVVFEAMLILELFLRLKIKNNRFINSFARATFTVFLIHSYFFKYLSIDRYVTSSILVMLGHILCSAVGIYIVCYGVYLVYDCISNKVFSALSEKRRLTFCVNE